MSGRISVIIPVYKVEKYLSRCVNSVLSQTYSVLEIILVDDGSPDNCPVICDEYAAKDARVCVIHKANGGLSSARNAGLGICTGEWIFFIDSDDWLADENVLSDFMEKAKSEQSDFVYGLMNRADDTNCSELKANERFVDDDLFFLSNSYMFSACNKLYAHTLFQRIQFVTGRVNEDVDIIPLVFCKAKKVSRLNRATYNYYFNPGSITRSAFSEKCFDMFKSVKNAYENFTGTEEQREVLYENLFGFQLFSTYIGILKIHHRKEREKYLKRFVSLIREYKFKQFYAYSFWCFIRNERFPKKLKKLAALGYLRLYAFLVMGVTQHTSGMEDIS